MPIDSLFVAPRFLYSSYLTGDLEAAASALEVFSHPICDETALTRKTSPSEAFAAYRV